MHTRIRKAREALGYTRERFAELLDVSVSYMAEVEWIFLCGSTAVPEERIPPIQRQETAVPEQRYRT